MSSIACWHYLGLACLLCLLGAWNLSFSLGICTKWLISQRETHLGLAQPVMSIGNKASGRTLSQGLEAVKPGTGKGNGTLEETPPRTDPGFCTHVKPQRRTQGLQWSLGRAPEWPFRGFALAAPNSRGLLPWASRGISAGSPRRQGRRAGRLRRAPDCLPP